jgi:hypothetical protein
MIVQRLRNWRVINIYDVYRQYETDVVMCNSVRKQAELRYLKIS